MGFTGSLVRIAAVLGLAAAVPLVAVAVAPSLGIDGAVFPPGVGLVLYLVLLTLAVLGAGAWVVVRPGGT